MYENSPYEGYVAVSSKNKTNDLNEEMALFKIDRENLNSSYYGFIN